jgi:hypothetical protein
LVEEIKVDYQYPVKQEKKKLSYLLYGRSPAGTSNRYSKRKMYTTPPSDIRDKKNKENCNVMES